MSSSSKIRVSPRCKLVVDQQTLGLPQMGIFMMELNDVDKQYPLGSAYVPTCIMLHN